MTLRKNPFGASVITKSPQPDRGEQPQSQRQARGTSGYKELIDPRRVTVPYSHSEDRENIESSAIEAPAETFLRRLVARPQ